MPKRHNPILFLLLLAIFLGSCGGGSGGNGSVTPPAPPPDPPPSAPDFSQIQAEIDRHPVADMAIIIGDETGPIWSYEKGMFTLDRTVNIASATKLYTGLAVWSLVDAGRLSLDDNPQEYISFWTDDSFDPRSKITLEQLMGFRSGFNLGPANGTCAGRAGINLSECVQQIYDDGLDSQPGTAFAYGPEHMQIAGLMVRGATGLELSEVMRDKVFTPAGVGDSTFFRQDLGDNVRYSGAIRSTARDYGRVLTALMDGRHFSSLSEFTADRQGMTGVEYTLPTLVDNQLDWHYGFGFWIECDFYPFAESCAQNPTISSPGAFGFLPWVDFEAGYWAVIAMDEPISSDPTEASVKLEQILQPMISEQLNQ